MYVNYFFFKLHMQNYKEPCFVLSFDSVSNFFKKVLFCVSDLYANDFSTPVHRVFLGCEHL